MRCKYKWEMKSDLYLQGQGEVIPLLQGLLLPPDLDLREPTARLNRVGQAKFNIYLMQFAVDNYDLTIFPDARAIVKGTEDETVAKNLYAKYIGM